MSARVQWGKKMKESIKAAGEYGGVVKECIELIGVLETEGRARDAHVIEKAVEAIVLQQQTVESLNTEIVRHVTGQHNEFVD